MTASEDGAAVAKRLAVSALVALLVVGGAVALPALTASSPDREPLDTPAYDADTLAATPSPATGEVVVNATSGEGDGVVVVDATHSNRFSRADLAPLVDALAALGYGVRFHDGDENLYQALSGASAFVVVDPAEEFAPNEVTTVRTFTGQGGHLLMLGEPTRKRVSSGFFGTSITDQESALTALTARYGLSLGTAYLSALETNGGNYKHVVAGPPDASDLDADRVTLFTAAAVHTRGGTVLLETTDDTHEAGLDGARSHPVAVRTERGNALLVGDSSFLRADRSTVADNERFVAYLVDFLVSGTPRADDDEGGNGNTTATSVPATEAETETEATASTTRRPRILAAATLRSAPWSSLPWSA